MASQCGYPLNCSLNCDSNIGPEVIEKVQRFYEKVRKDLRLRKEFFRMNITRNTVGLKNVYSYELNGISCCVRKFYEVLGLKKSEANIADAFNDEVVVIDKTNWRTHSQDFKNKIEEFVLRKYEPKHSHYNLVNCPKRLYIDSKFNATYTGMYKSFAKELGFEPNINLSNHSVKIGFNDNQCSYTYFYLYVKKKLNIGINMLSSDICCDSELQKNCKTQVLCLSSNIFVYNL